LDASDFEVEEKEDQRRGTEISASQEMCHQDNTIQEQQQKSLKGSSGEEQRRKRRSTASQTERVHMDWFPPRV
jgi:hypothetical protein